MIWYNIWCNTTHDTIYDMIYNMIQYNILVVSPWGNLSWTPVTHLAALTVESINRNSRTNNNPHIKNVHISRNRRPHTTYMHAHYSYKTKHIWTEHHNVIAQSIWPQIVYWGMNEFLKQFSLHREHLSVCQMVRAHTQSGAFVTGQTRLMHVWVQTGHRWAVGRGYQFLPSSGRLYQKL